ncbi:MAG: restriction endonuclease subunit S [Thermoanaerobacteraceae bacterium]|nr:restriction endonuclease subunit S [Thermoanaerobacteraceae bacterium]
MGSEIVSIADVAEIVLGGTPNTKIPEYWNGTIKWATAKDISSVSGKYLYDTEKSITGLGLEKSSAKILGKDTIVISARGTVGKICMLPYPMAFNQTCYGLIAKQDIIDPHYLYYNLFCLSEQINSLSYGTTFNTITKKTFNDIKFKLPPLPEQQKIASILSAFDDEIELNNEMNKTLEEMAQAIFKHWFIDFEFPNENGEPYKSSGGEFVDSELGPIPKGWKVGVLSELCDVNMGQSPPSSTYNLDKKGISFYQGVKDFGTKYPSVTMYCLAPKKIAAKGDILLSVRAPVGEINVAIEKCCIGRGLAALRMKKGANNYLYYLMLNQKNNWTIFENGSVFTAINKAAIENLPIFIPPVNIIKKFNTLIQPVDERILNNTKENLFLSQLRDTLLPKLISGEIRVV